MHCLWPPVLNLFFDSSSLFVPVGRWLHSGSSNMAVLEVPLFSGFRADTESLEQVSSSSGSAGHDLGPAPALPLPGIPFGEQEEANAVRVRALPQKMQLKGRGGRSRRLPLSRNHWRAMSEQMLPAGLAVCPAWLSPEHSAQ